MKLPEEDLPIDHEIIPPMTRSLGDRSHETITGVPPQSEYIKSRSSNDGSNLRPNLNKGMMEGITKDFACVQIKLHIILNILFLRFSKSQHSQHLRDFSAFKYLRFFM